MAESTQAEVCGAEWEGPCCKSRAPAQIRLAWGTSGKRQHQRAFQATPLVRHIKSPNHSEQMSERGNFRGGGRGGGGRGRGGGDRGGRGGGGAGNKDGGERKKENILDLNKYMDKAMTVKFNGGREGEFGVDWVWIDVSRKC